MKEINGKYFNLRAPRSRLHASGGMTMIELLVASSISTIVLLAFYSVFISQNRAKTAQDRVAEMQQNLRIADEMIERDIRSSGFGLARVPAATIRAITVENSSSGPDAITLWSNFNDTKAYTGAGFTSSPGSGVVVTVSMADGSAVTDSFQKCDFAVIDDAGSTEASVITNVSGSNLTLKNLNFLHSGRLMVYDIKGRRYAVDTTRPELPVNLYIHKGSTCNPNADPPVLNEAHTVAEGIEDLQFGYGLDTTIPADGIIDSWSDNPADASQVRVVEVNVLARTPSADRSWVNGLRPGLRDRSGAAGKDGFRRRLLKKNVTVRNLTMTSQ